MPEEPLENNDPGDQDDVPPPLFGSWRRLYAIVLVHLVFWIVILYLFTSRFHIPS